MSRDHPQSPIGHNFEQHHPPAGKSCILYYYCFPSIILALNFSYFMPSFGPNFNKAMHICANACVCIYLCMHVLMHKLVCIILLNLFILKLNLQFTKH